ncbi:MAG TPA: hypothetical protein VGE07_29795 [Herpetosiphonaceae bacterium]
MRFTQRGLVAVLGFVLCISLIGNGVLLVRHQQHVAARQQARTLAAEQIWADLGGAHNTLNLAHDTMRSVQANSTHKGWADVYSALQLVDLNLYRSARVGTVYAYMVPAADDVMTVINGYAGLLIPPQVNIERGGSIRAEEEWRITDLQHDLTLLQRLFPQDLLINGSAMDFHQAFLAYCTQRHIFSLGNINTRCTERRTTPPPR